MDYKALIIKAFSMFKLSGEIEFTETINEDVHEIQFIDYLAERQSDADTWTLFYLDPIYEGSYVYATESTEIFSHSDFLMIVEYASKNYHSENLYLNLQFEYETRQNEYENACLADWVEYEENNLPKNAEEQTT